MVVTGAAIKSNGWVQDANDSSYREVSYDLTIGELGTPDGKLVEEFDIPPQGIVKIISRETVKVPNFVVGYVHVKTSLCNEGILPLNIGLVDPGYDGPLQSTLINFGKATVPLRKGEVFSRLVFHRLDSPVTEQPNRVQRDSARASVKKQIHIYMPATFLDVAQTAKKAAEEAFGSFKKALFWWVPIAAIVIAMLTFALNYMNLWAAHSVYRPEDAARTELLKGRMENGMTSLVEQNKKLQTEVDLLKAALEKQSSNKSKGAVGR